MSAQEPVVRNTGEKHWAEKPSPAMTQIDDAAIQVSLAVVASPNRVKRIFTEKVQESGVVLISGYLADGTCRAA